jgi:hypothetical protein
MLIHMTPHPKLFKRKGGAAPEPEAPSAIDQVRAELLKANNDAGGRPLPVALHNTSVVEGGITPDYVLAQLDAGHRAMPAFRHFDPTTPAATVEAYATTGLAKLRSYGLPLYLRGTQWESRLYDDAAILAAPAADNPTVEYLGERYVSIYGLTSYWETVGTYWVDNAAFRVYETLYPDAPKVLWFSNNEHRRLWPLTAENDSRWVDENGDPALKTDQEKRDIWNPRWQERTLTLHNALKAGMSLQAWRDNLTLLGHNAIGLQVYGRYAGWTIYSTYTTGRFSVSPTRFGGTSEQAYLTDGALGYRDYRCMSPQIEAMNQVFMRAEAEALDPDFWWESILWDGNQAFYDQCAAEGHPFTPERYRGLAQWIAWLLQPRTLAEYRDSDQQLTTYSDYWDEVVRAVDVIYDHSTLTEFWRSGTLVPSGNTHPYQTDLHTGYTDAEVARDFLLTCSANPARPWTTTTQVNVFALARLLGTTPNRRWLLYLYSPLYQFEGITVTIPNYQAVTVNATPGGYFYLVDEALGTCTKLTGSGLQEPAAWAPVNWGEGGWEHTGTWSLGGTVWINTPTVGAEALVGGDMETGNPPEGWLSSGSATLAGAADERTGGTGAQSLSVVNGAASYGLARKQATLPAYSWWRYSAWAKKVTANAILSVADGTTQLSYVLISATDWTAAVAAGFNSSDNPYVRAQVGTNTLGHEVRLDDASLKPLVPKELMLTQDTGSATVTAEVAIPAHPMAQPVGVVVRVDDRDDPQNYVVALVGYNTSGGTAVRLVKCVNGVLTTVMNYTTITWANGAKLRVVASGTTYQVFYNEAQVGADQTIDEATINSNTRHGGFSTNPSVGLDTLTVS